MQCKLSNPLADTTELMPVSYLLVKETSMNVMLLEMRSSPCRFTQWCRSVAKYGGLDQSDQAIKLFQAPRKISFTFHF